MNTHPNNEICYLLNNNLGELINPFPILTKDTYLRIEEIVNNDPLMSNRTYNSHHVSILSLLRIYEGNKDALLYGTSVNNGYPINEVLQAIAYVIADSTELFGKRPLGYIQILERHSHEDPMICVEMKIPDLLTPIIIVGNGLWCFGGGC